MHESKGHANKEHILVRTIGLKSNPNKNTNLFDFLTKQDTEKSRQSSFNFEQTGQIILSKR